MLKKNIKVLTVFGTRPEAIKMAPLVSMFIRTKFIKNVVCVTAQHREMLDQVLSLFNIKADYDLDIMKQRQSLSDITSNVIIGMESVIEKENPDIVLVHGDTTTTFGAALAAFYKRKKVGHVEAGLRTFNKWFPFPEEMNRKLTCALADIHFAPTQTAKQNLLNEGVEPSKIFVTGNTVIDALKTTVKQDYVFNNEILKQIDFKKQRVVLLTAHRRENWGKPMEHICMAVREIVDKFKDIEVVYPVHYNPAVRETVYPILDKIERIHLMDPLDTEELHNLMSRCYLVLTDSGGIQEEAPSLAKPVLVLRDVTERPEAVEAGTVKVVGTDKRRIYNEVEILLTNRKEYARMSESINPYGDGRASERILKALLYHFGLIDEKPEEFSV
ncbi:MAG: hypothetical protein PWQ82_1448 [Thermosediminibacterales bacterium]|nr:hypothetical protein [Thermosediminibacterales bacterium]MDK2836025.1 hypothetical protein [Thermosediminibacterales bacterium]